MMKNSLSALLAFAAVLPLPAAEYLVEVHDRENTRAVYVDARNVTVQDSSYIIQASTEINVSTVFVVSTSSSVPMGFVQQGAPTTINRVTLTPTTIGYNAMTFDPPLPLRSGDGIGFSFTNFDPINVQFVLYGIKPLADGQRLH